MSAHVLIGCPGCRKKIRIPSDSGTVHVTCPACGEQWDWRGRHVRAGTFLGGVSGGVRRCWRAVFPSGRFSYGHLAIALAGGIGIGIVLDMKLHIRSWFHQDRAFVPTGTFTGEPAATNILAPPEIKPKPEAASATNLGDLQPWETAP